MYMLVRIQFRTSLCSVASATRNFSLRQMNFRRSTSWAGRGCLNSNTRAICRKGFSTGAYWSLQMQMMGRLVRCDFDAALALISLIKLRGRAHKRTRSHHATAN